MKQFATTSTIFDKKLLIFISVYICFIKRNTFHTDDPGHFIAVTVTGSPSDED